ncbi:MAG: metallophosphoesterase [Syntrophomonas sp.]
MAVLYYLLLAVLMVDIIRLINYWTGIIPKNLYKSPALIGVGVLLLVLLLVLYGTWNANHPVVKNYEVSINKKAGNLDEMRIVVVSDLHLGWIVGIDRMADMVKRINSLQPDLVLIAGDTIDEGIDPSAEQKIPAMIGMLNPRFGTYAVLGNHEYISGNVQTTISNLDKAGIKVLRDQYVKVADNFYVVGRDDRSCKRYTGKERLALSKVMAGIDNKRLPIILLDHEPVDLNIAEEEGVDLQFSGHTHLGQLFPNNFITGLIYEDDWGYHKKANLQVIVSCGFGTWGPPIRIGNCPEILNVLVRFAP